MFAERRQRPTRTTRGHENERKSSTPARVSVSRAFDERRKFVHYLTGRGNCNVRAEFDGGVCERGNRNHARGRRTDGLRSGGRGPGEPVAAAAAVGFSPACGRPMPPGSTSRDVALGGCVSTSFYVNFSTRRSCLRPKGHARVSRHSRFRPHRPNRSRQTRDTGRV